MASSPIITKARQTSFSREGLQPPSALFIDRGDRIRIRVISSLGATIVARARVLMPNGEIIPNEWRIGVTASYAVLTTDNELPEGFLLSLSIHTSSAGMVWGNIYAQASIIRGSGNNVIDVANLTAGYLTTNLPVTYPTMPPMGPFDSGGAIRSLGNNNPAAGAEVSQLISSRLRIIAAQASLVTDATVANRRVTWIVDDGATEVFRFRTGTDQPASQTVLYVISNAPNFTDVAGTIIHANIPVDLILMGGYRLRTSTANLQAGDNWGLLNMFGEEWLEM